MSRVSLGRVAGVAVLVLLLALPWMINAYAISTVTRVLVFGLLAISVNLLTGVTGLPTLGQAAYFGVGAYTGAIVSTTITDVGIVQVVLAALAATVAAAVTGPVAMRARGVAFLMITLAIGEIAYTAARRLEPVTHGTDGYSGIPPVVPLPGMPALLLDGLVYYWVLAVFLLLYGIVALVRRSSFGLALRGLRDNEARLRAIGYPSGVFGVAAYCFAGAIAGVAGALWANAQQFVAPADMGFQVAALALLAVVIGGVGSMWGAVLGAGLVVFTQDYIGGFLAGHGHLLLGVLFVLAVYLIPRGVAGMTWKRPGSKRGADPDAGSERVARKGVSA